MKQKTRKYFQFRSAEDATKAVEQLNGFDLAGKNIKLQIVDDERVCFKNYNIKSDSTYFRFETMSYLEIKKEKSEFCLNKPPSLLQIVIAQFSGVQTEGRADRRKAGRLNGSDRQAATHGQIGSGSRSVLLFFDNEIYTAL